MLLAAGVGRRLSEVQSEPKSLLRFAGRSLLERHLEALRVLGVNEVLLCTGYEAGLLERELAATGFETTVRRVHNPRYSLGSVVSLWCAREAFGEGPTLLMDADVLYHPDVLGRLVSTRVENCFLLDRDFLPGEEPVKLCVREGRLVEFRKRLAPGLRCDFQGESVGFFRFGAEAGRRLAARAAQYVDDGRLEEPYEEVIRDLLLETPEQFGFEDVTGLPWLEIDFPEDIERAHREVLPRIEVKA